MLEMNPVGKPYALIGHVRFDEGLLVGCRYPTRVYSIAFRG